jgi:hypothetical protein
MGHRSAHRKLPNRRHTLRRDSATSTPGPKPHVHLPPLRRGARGNARARAWAVHRTPLDGTECNVVHRHTTRLQQSERCGFYRVRYVARAWTVRESTSAVAAHPRSEIEPAADASCKKGAVGGCRQCLGRPLRTPPTSATGLAPCLGAREAPCGPVWALAALAPLASCSSAGAGPSEQTTSCARWCLPASSPTQPSLAPFLPSPSVLSDVRVTRSGMGFGVLHTQDFLGLD